MAGGDMGMFGAPIGDVNYSAQQRDAVANLHTLGQTAAIPGQVAERAALTRLYGAEADTKEMQLQVDRAMRDLMNKAYGGGVPGAPVGPDGQPRSQADMLDEVARLAGQAGDVKKSADLANKASLIRMHEASTELAQSRAGVAQLTAQKNEAELIGRLFSDVTDQASWERANNLYAFQSKQESPLARVPYSPELVTQLRNAALSTKDKLDLQIKEANRRDLSNFRRMRLNQHDTANSLAARRTQVAEGREARLAREGGGSRVSSPQEGEVAQAARLIKEDFAQLDTTSLSNAAYTIASEARALRGQNRALDSTMALQRAYTAARERGDFKDTTAPTLLGFGPEAKTGTRYTGGGRTLDTAIPAPENASRRVVGRYYTTSAGTFQWAKEGDKFGWKEVSSRAIDDAAERTAREEDDEEGEEE